MRSAMLFGNFQIINIHLAKCLEKRCCEIIESKLNDNQCGFRPGRSIADHISLSSKILRNLGSIIKTSSHALSTSRKHTTGFLVKSFGELWQSSSKEDTTTHLGQLRKSTGEFGRSAQGTPMLTIKKLRPARFRSTSRSVLLSDESVFTHGFIKSNVKHCDIYLLIQTTRVYYSMVY